MPITAKPGTHVRVTIARQITRAAAAKTIERLFLKDKSKSKPLATRARNFKPIPKRRGGRIWTKWPNKIHITLRTGDSATIPATAQTVRDLNSVEGFVQVAAA